MCNFCKVIFSKHSCEAICICFSECAKCGYNTTESSPSRRRRSCSCNRRCCGWHFFVSLNSLFSSKVSGLIGLSNPLQYLGCPTSNAFTRAMSGLSIAANGMVTYCNQYDELRFPELDYGQFSYFTHLFNAILLMAGTSFMALDGFCTPNNFLLSITGQSALTTNSSKFFAYLAGTLLGVSSFRYGYLNRREVPQALKLLENIMRSFVRQSFRQNFYTLILWIIGMILSVNLAFAVAGVTVFKRIGLPGQEPLPLSPLLKWIGSLSQGAIIFSGSLNALLEFKPPGPSSPNTGLIRNGSGTGSLQLRRPTLVSHTSKKCKTALFIVGGLASVPFLNLHKQLAQSFSFPQGMEIILLLFLALNYIWLTLPGTLNSLGARDNSDDRSIEPPRNIEPSFYHEEDDDDE